MSSGKCHPFCLGLTYNYTINLANFVLYFALVRNDERLGKTEPLHSINCNYVGEDSQSSTIKTTYMIFSISNGIKVCDICIQLKW